MTGGQLDTAFFEAEMAVIEQMIEAGSGDVDAGRALDLSELEGRIAVLCQNLKDAAADLEDRDRIRHRLEGILEGLDSLEKRLVARVEELGAALPGNADDEAGGR